MKVTAPDRPIYFGAGLMFKPGLVSTVSGRDMPRIAEAIKAGHLVELKGKALKDAQAGQLAAIVPDADAK